MPMRTRVVSQMNIGEPQSNTLRGNPVQSPMQTNKSSKSQKNNIIHNNFNNFYTNSFIES